MLSTRSVRMLPAYHICRFPFWTAFLSSESFTENYSQRDKYLTKKERMSVMDAYEYINNGFFVSLEITYSYVNSRFIYFFNY